MHYRNGREAKNGDMILSMGFDNKLNAIGILYNATPGNDYCNGNITPIQQPAQPACLCDCLHIDDVMEILTSHALGRRPTGK